MQEGTLDVGAMSETVSRLVSTWGLRVLGALAVLIVGWLVAKAVRASARKGLGKHLDPTLVPFLSSLIYYAMLTFVVLAVLGLFGIQTTSFVAVLGAAGLAVGLALQGTLSNFAAGVMLLVFRPFRKGDRIEAAGQTGVVSEIGIFATSLVTPDNVKIIVGNGAVYGSTIKNYSAFDTRRVDMVFGVSYDDDLGVASSTIERVVTAHERVLKDPAPTIAVSELADSSVNFIVRPWVKAEDYWGVYLDLTRSLKEQLEAAGCSIPYPQRDVHLHQMGNTPQA